MKVRLLLAAISFATVAACEALPLGARGTRVDAVTITGADGQVVASTVGSSGVVGQITLASGNVRRLTVNLFDEAGRPVALSPSSMLEVRTTAPSVAEWRAEAAGTGEIAAVGSGTTALHVEYRFGGALEYASPAIPVLVQ